MGQSSIPLPKAIFPEYWIKSDMSHSDGSIFGKQYKTHKSEIKLQIGQICQIWGMRIFFFMEFTKVGEHRGLLGREMSLKKMKKDVYCVT